VPFSIQNFTDEETEASAEVKYSLIVIKMARNGDRI
jgi:hypothetical protein